MSTTASTPFTLAVLVLNEHNMKPKAGESDKTVDQNIYGGTGGNGGQGGQLGGPGGSGEGPTRRSIYSSSSKVNTNWLINSLSPLNDVIRALYVLLATEYVVIDFPAPSLPHGITLPLFSHPLEVNTSTLDKAPKLTKKEHEEAESALVEFGNTVYRAEHKLPSNRSRPKSAYFPSSIVHSLVDNLLGLDSLTKLEKLVEPWYFSCEYRVRLYAIVHDLFSSISARREQARLDKNAKQRATRKAKKKVADWDASDKEEEEETESESSYEEEVNEDRRSSPIPPASKHSRRILEEVTNEERPPPTRATRKPVQQAIGKPVQRAARKKLEKAAEGLELLSSLLTELVALADPNSQGFLSKAKL
ncbi:hypothetical protein B0H14DRAFT_3440121 [Mycena olivaceomarginata]|nr:hypothetical protein B0H14DRAFT_3440121 [Mycena olivaceomarginata]